MSESTAGQDSENNTGFSVYLDRRMFRILMLGIMSGFPWVLIATALSLWLKEEGLSRSAIGWAGLIFGVYAVNWMWAPLVDRIRIPVLTDKIGHRKSWILSMQVLILLSLVAWSVVNPVDNLGVVIFVGLIIAISSATQDITIDALRIEQVGEHESAAMAAGAAVAVVGWWSGYKLGGMIALVVADYLQSQGHDNYWQLAFIFMCGLVVLFNIALLMIPEVSSEMRRKRQLEDQQKLGTGVGLPAAASWFASTILSPMTSFFRKNGVSIGIAILSFIFLFKIGEAFMGKMSIVFYKEMGFSKSDIALYSKGLGWVTTVVFTLIGGWFAMRAGSLRALFLAGVAMAATNIMFSVLAWTGKSEAMFALAVVMDDVAAAFATVAFVAFISRLVDRTYTATQYALLASIGTLGRTLLASSSGAMVDALGGDWGLFFVITALMVIPSLILLWFLRDKINFKDKREAVAES
ncbi:MAG: AmpG permease [uncultured Thiotrichaceae bacterium]|uniref:AmpG permease n=1 Tax=uncultured Thiotrichaceae bacterium TaxID=298394 RepID=A0A6S6TXX6_9GAMM|nr:MAG: AmpG permease [uncultured Thiotrichaceae bacterium]